MKPFLGLLAMFVTIGVFGVLMITSPDDVVTLGWLGVAVLALIYVGMTSIYLVDADKMLTVFFLQSYRWTYLPSAFADSTNERGGIMIDYPKARRGLLGSNVVVALWPLWSVVYTPLTSIELRVHATRVYTKDKGKTSPSLPIQAKITIVVLLAPDLRDFFHTFNVLGKGMDLASDCVIHDNLWEPNQQNPRAHTYRGPVIAAIMLRTLESVILEATRKTGSQFPWRGKGSIKENKQDWEDALRFELANPESMFARGGILVQDRDPVTGVETALHGNAVREIDFNIEDIDVEDAVARAALSRPMIETLEAEAQERKGVGEGRRIKKIVAETSRKDAAGNVVNQLTPGQVLKADVAKNIKEVTGVTIGKTLFDALGKFIGK